MSLEEILDLAHTTVRQEMAGLETLLDQLDDSLVRAAEMMLVCQGHVLTAGCGTSGHVAARMAHLLSCCGTPALFIHPSDSQHGLSGAVTARDVLFVISKGGETTEVNCLARIAKQRGASLISLTEKPASTLGQMSDVVLCLHAPPEGDLYGMIATGSSLFNAAACDALCAVLLCLRGYSQAQFGQTHPGGAVGLRLAQEKDGHSYAH